MSRERLTLKWGTAKSWNVNEGSPAYEALKRWCEMGVSISLMTHHDTPAQKAALCEAIDALDADTVYLSWDDKEVTKEEAKRYVMEYGR